MAIVKDWIRNVLAEWVKFSPKDAGSGFSVNRDRRRFEMGLRKHCQNCILLCYSCYAYYYINIRKGEFLLTDYFYHDPFPSLSVKLRVKDLLPRSEVKPAFGYRQDHLMVY